MKMYNVIGFLIFLNTLIVYFDRVNIAIVAPVMMKEFGWDAGILGIIMSMFGVGYILSQIPAGWLADKMGGGKILVGGSLVWTICTALTPFATTPALMYAIRGILGAGEGVNFPAETSVLARWLPHKARARIQGLNLSGIAAGPLIATPLTVWVMTTYGWPAAFYFFAAISLAWTIVWVLVYTDDPAKHPKVSEAELAEIMSERDADVEVKAGSTPFKSPAVWGLALSYFCFTYTWWLFLNWLPTYLVQARGFSLLKMGLFASIPWLLAFITMNMSGWISDALVKKGMATGTARRILLYVGIPGMSIFLWFAAQATEAMTAVVLLAIAMALAGLNFPSFWTLPIDMDPNSAGLISGVMNSGSALAAILAPLLTGFIVASFGWLVALNLAAILGIVAAGLVYITAPRRVKKMETSV